MERRDVLRSMLGGLAALGAAPLVASQNNADLTAAMSKLQLVTGGKVNKTKGLASVGLEVPAESFGTQWLHEEVHELERFAGLLDSDVLFPPAVSIPFGTTPMNIYARLNDTHYELPAPKIPTLLRYFLAADHTSLDLAVHLLFARRLSTLQLPKELMFVEEIPRQVPNIIKNVPVRADRTISPRYTFDVDEADIKGRSLPHLVAAVLLGMVYGVAKEMESKWLAAQAAIAAGPCGNDPHGVFYVYRRPQLYLERKAYMLDGFCHMIAAGVIYTV